ncbi:S8 family serine peptidase [Sediminibacterium soli]|uniref:S8 family serine peptidase n=1 Tax=Sediminibacterium soli TaxID=2698829 RepID=UPI0013798498|nr:S8 family serine peptidase [Sediminibacterium soli]NCI45576.1 S8 family serine peptidase [Sediminibacterium soli]
MTKKNALILLGSFLFFQSATAQVVTNSRLLRQAAVDFKLRFDANFAKAMQLARERNWPLSYKTKNGQKAILVGLDDFNQPKYYISFNNTTAAATTRANQLWPGGRTGLSLSGSSSNMLNKLGVWDAGTVLTNHVELNGRVTIKDNPVSDDNDHATHVSGTLMAQGVNPSAKGMAYGLKGMVAYDLLNDESEMFNEAPNLLLSNHSYGLICGWNYNSDQSRWEFYGDPGENEDFKFGYYNSESQNIDSIAYNAPYYLIVKASGNNRSSNGPAVGQPYYRKNAQGTMVNSGNRPTGISSNDGYDIIPADNGAKNILTVGAVSGIPAGYNRKEDVIMSGFSSWGPTDDGRIKPDVVADGVNVLSSIASSTTSYAIFSGTSMATPNATGSLLLLQEYYSKLKGSATAFLRSATLRGLAIHTADEAGASPGPDYQFGWGLLNVEKAADVLTAAVPSNNATTSRHLMYENTLAQGQTFTTTVIASGNGPLVATICWTDVKGSVDLVNKLNNRAKKLVNDLDIRITKGSGSSLVTYQPWTLDVNNPANPAVPGDNITDNVERIDIDTAVVPGTVYTITVTHKGTLVKGQQAYSLLVSGAGGISRCTSGPGSNTGARIDNVTFRNINVTNPAGNTSYTDNTRFTATIEPSQTSAISVKVGSSDATDVPKMVKVFIDYNNNGTFDAAEQVAASSATLSSNAVFTANISTPSTITVGYTYLMRVIVQETSNAADIAGCGSYGRGETQDYRVRVVNPTNDLSLSAIVSPKSGDCASPGEYVTIAIANTGSIAQSNIPLTLAIGASGGPVTNLSASYPGTIQPLSTVNYTFQAPVVLAAATTYTITATASLASDQYAGNNQLTGVVATSAAPAAPSAIASICGNTANLKVTNPDASNYFWYTTPSGGAPVANGATTSTTTIPGDKTYYLSKEVQASVGPANKLVYPQGGYNAFSGNYIKFNNSVPLIIQTARLYVGYPGKIKFNVGNLTIENADGSYSYQFISSTIVDAYATNPTPAPGPVSGNIAADTGNIFYLNLPVIPTGDHIINIVLLNPDGTEMSAANTATQGATLFRNNNITGTTTYPTTLQRVMQFTGNSAHTNGAQESQYYYFFYDTRVISGCTSNRVAIVGTDVPTPAITLVGDSLVSSVATGNQWYVNDTLISGASGTKYKPTRNGQYKVVTMDQFGCQKTSNVINYVLTAIDPVAAAREINLMVTPNPNNGVFNLSFEVTAKADLSIELLSSSGQKVYSEFRSGFTGKYTKQVSVTGVSSDVYMLRINHAKKNYVQKLIIQR